MKLIKANLNDAQNLWKMQVEAFSELYERYNDTETSPATEKIDKTINRLSDPDTSYYYITVDNNIVGAIRVADPIDKSIRKRISPLFIMPEFRNKGYAQKAMTLAEEIHGSNHWELITILEEKGNCHLYEKMGYHKTGEQIVVNDKMTLVFYNKD